MNVNSYAPATGKFISAVWRRILLIRIVESIAIAIATAAAAGLALMPILWWRAESGLPLALAMLILGTAIGLVWGISRRPSRFGAAVEADRQLNLHDLLGTVYLLADVASDSWRESLAVISDARCRSLRPSAVVVNRLGLRAWGGVGILGALLITLGLFTSRPIEVNAAASMSESNPLAGLPVIQLPVAVANENTRPMARPPGPGGTDDISNRGFEQDRPDDSQANALSKTDSAQNHSASAANSAAGGGAVVTHSRQSPQESPPILAGAHTPSRSGPAAAGAGRSDAAAHSPGDFGGTLASPSRNLNAPAPPWQTSEWPADVAAARAAIGSRRVPDSDADLIRDYFHRD